MGGPRIRSIKPETWDDELIGRCSVLARLTFLGLISLADDEGRGRAGASFLRSRLHPHGIDVSIHGVLTALSELAATKRVSFYEVDGENFYWIKNFKRHQVINRPSKSTIPPEPSRSTHGALTEGSLSTHAGSESIGVYRTGSDRTVSDPTGPDALSTSAPSAALRSQARSAPGAENGTEHERAPSITAIAEELGLPDPLGPRLRKLTPEELEARKQELKAQLVEKETA